MTALLIEPLTPAARLRFALTDAVTAARRYLRHHPGGAEASVWSLQRPVMTTLGMSVILLGVMVPLTVRRYSRVSR